MLRLAEYLDKVYSANPYSTIVSMDAHLVACVAPRSIRWVQETGGGNRVVVVGDDDGSASLSGCSLDSVWFDDDDTRAK